MKRSDPVQTPSVNISSEDAACRTVDGRRFATFRCAPPAVRDRLQEGQRSRRDTCHQEVDSLRRNSPFLRRNLHLRRFFLCR